MDRKAIREFLNSKRIQASAAQANDISPQHLNGFLAGRDSISLPKLVKLVDWLRTEHGLDVTVDSLARPVAGDVTA